MSRPLPSRESGESPPWLGGSTREQLLRLGVRVDKQSLCLRLMPPYRAQAEVALSDPLDIPTQSTGSAKFAVEPLITPQHGLVRDATGPCQSFSRLLAARRASQGWLAAWVAACWCGAATFSRTWGSGLGFVGLLGHPPRESSFLAHCTCPPSDALPPRASLHFGT
jgi:hypothetical protein